MSLLRWNLGALLALALAYVLLGPRPWTAPQLLSEDAAVQPISIQLEPAEAAAAPARFAAALAIPSVADKDAPLHVGDPEPFKRMRDHLQRSFPLVYKKLKLEHVNEHSLLFTWTGSSPELRPMLTMAHYDVVPAPTGPGLSNWTHPPFGGVIEAGVVWGRGALDFKVGLMQQLEAISYLLRRGYAPKRTLLLAVGHDEEVGGSLGASAISALLASRGVHLELVLDEGGAVKMDGFGKLSSGYTLVDEPIALVGTAEKGYETVVIKVWGTGGHTGMPPTDASSVGARVGRILSALEAQPTATKLGAPVDDMVRALAPAVRVAPIRALMQAAKSRLINPIVGQLMGQAGRVVNPFVRTTCAVVGIQAGGIADNVLPPTGNITLNCRLLPGHDGSYVRQYLEAVTRKEAPHLSFRHLDGVLPPPVSRADGPHWSLIKQAILETLQPAPEKGPLIVAPYMASGMTDSRFYIPLAGGRTYRFAPQRYTAASLDLLHNVDERIEVADFLRGISFYARIFELATGDEGTEEAAAEAATARGSGAAATA